MVSVLTWLTDKTDNINLVIEVAVGIVVTAWVAGVRSKQKIQQWLLSPESDPYVDRIVGKVAEGVSVPTVEDIIRALPEPPDLSDKLALMEEKMGAKLTAVMEAKWATMGDALSQRVGQVVQANIASAKNAFRAGLRDEEGPDSNLGMLGEVLGAIGVDNGSITKLGKVKGMYSRFQQGGGLKGAMSQGNGGIQPGYSPGAQVTNERGTWILGQNLQWVLVTPTRPVPMPVLAAAPAESLPPELPPEPKKA